MKTIYNIAKNELRQLFFSPIAWILLVMFFVQCGIAFSEVISMLLRLKALGLGIKLSCCVCKVLSLNLIPAFVRACEYCEWRESLVM